MRNEIGLITAGALDTDKIEWIARVDSNAFETLGLVDEDMIEIRSASRTTAAVVWRAHSKDEGLGFIRIGPYTRNNLKVVMGDKVSIKKAVVKIAEEVILAPPPNQKAHQLPDFSEHIKKVLKDWPLTKGDVIPITIKEKIFIFVVADVEPAGIVRIEEGTEVVESEPLNSGLRL